MSKKRGASNVDNINNLTKKELIDCLVKNLHYNPKWEYCLLRFPKKKTYVVNIAFPSFDKECTHVLRRKCHGKIVWTRGEGWF